jgi:hypothetical protein
MATASGAPRPTAVASPSASEAAAALPTTVRTTSPPVGCSEMARTKRAAVSHTYSVPPSGATKRPFGPEKVADSAGPSAVPMEPVPASVDTTAVAITTLRILLAVLSDTYMVAPAGSKVSAWGPLWVAAVPTPFAVPAVPLPDSVVTAPTGDTARTRLFTRSATKQKEALVQAMPRGRLKSAAAPTRSANPATPVGEPATALTTPEGNATKRTLLPIGAIAEPLA